MSQQPALYVDVFQNDGSVRHVLRPPRSGGVSSPHVEFVAGPATGVSFVVAVGAASALELGVRPDLEKASEYLPILRSRLEGAGTPPLADIALVTVRAMEPPVAKVRLPEPGLARAPAARPAGLRSSRCSNILARAELGEVLSDEELAVLRTQCRS